MHGIARTIAAKGDVPYAHGLRGEILARKEQHAESAAAYGRAYNVTGEETVTQVGLVELIAEVMGRRVELIPFDPARLRDFPRPGPVFGQNLVYECHAVHTTYKLRGDLGVRPRYTLASGLAQTWQWYRDHGPRERAVDFGFEDQLLATLRA